MMDVNKINSTDDIVNYIDGCLNDMELGISTKNETAVNLCELVAVMHKKAERHFKNNVSLHNVILQGEQLVCVDKHCSCGREYSIQTYCNVCDNDD